MNNGLSAEYPFTNIYSFFAIYKTLSTWFPPSMNLTLNLGFHLIRTDMLNRLQHRTNSISSSNASTNSIKQQWQKCKYITTHGDH